MEHSDESVTGDVLTVLTLENEAAAMIQDRKNSVLKREAYKMPGVHEGREAGEVTTRQKEKAIKKHPPTTTKLSTKPCSRSSEKDEIGNS